MGAVAPPPADGGRVRGRPPRGHGGQRADTPTTVTPSSPPATGKNEAADIAEEWLAEEAETSPCSRWMRKRIPLPPTGARSLPRPRRPGGETWTRMVTWTSTTRRSPHPRTLRGDPAETHRDPLAEDHQDPPGGRCNRVGFPPLGYPPRHRSQDRSKPPTHTTYPWGGMQ